MSFDANEMGIKRSEEMALRLECSANPATKIYPLK